MSAWGDEEVNDRLRASMVQARMDIDKVADRLQVDPKTVQRWLNGRVPHTRHRWSLADLLDEDEHYLWPPEDRGVPGASPNAELLAAYTHRADVAPEVWWERFAASRERVDLLGHAMLFLMEQHPQLPPLLQRKAAEGCRVRIALADPDSPEAAERDREEQLEGGLQARIRTARRYFAVLDGRDGVDIHYHRTPLYNSLFRFDDHMIVTPHLYGVPGYSAPLLHLRRKGGGGLFDSFAGHFEAVWATSTPAARRAVEARAGDV
jgi:transcriptional regulator with XRE-family HTH domain